MVDLSKVGVSGFLYATIGLTAVIIIACCFGFVASAMLLHAADADSLSDGWKRSARGLGGWNLAMFFGLLVFGVYIMVKAVQYKDANRQSVSEVFRAVAVGDSNNLNVPMFPERAALEPAYAPRPAREELLTGTSDDLPFV